MRSSEDTRDFALWSTRNVTIGRERESGDVYTIQCTPHTTCANVIIYQLHVARNYEQRRMVQQLLHAGVIPGTRRKCTFLYTGGAGHYCV